MLVYHEPTEVIQPSIMHIKMSHSILSQHLLNTSMKEAWKTSEPRFVILTQSTPSTVRSLEGPPQEGQVHIAGIPKEMAT